MVEASFGIDVPLLDDVFEFVLFACFQEIMPLLTYHYIMLLTEEWAFNN